MRTRFTDAFREQKLTSSGTRNQVKGTPNNGPFKRGLPYTTGSTGGADRTVLEISVQELPNAHGPDHMLAITSLEILGMCDYLSDRPPSV